MTALDAVFGPQGSLAARLIRPSKPHKGLSISLPGMPKIIVTRDRGEGAMFAKGMFATNLHALHRDGDNKIVGEHDLGSGLVTNVGMTSLANDYAWASPALPINTLALAKWVGVGTGVTAAAATDIAMQTLAKPTETLAVAGVNSLVSAANLQIIRNIATVNFTSTLAITEWGLHSAEALSVTTGTPLTAKTAATATVTGTPYTESAATVQGEQGLIIEAEKAVACYGLILKNTKSVLTIPAWYKVSDGTAAAEPEATSPFKIKPVLLDHKVFAALNVVSGDSIQFTYSFTCTSGG